jgi:peptide subunit release factor 1 (eRF1)
MIARTAVDALRDRPPTPDSPLLSVYLDVDQSRAVNLNRGFVAPLKARVRTLEHGLADETRDALRADAERVVRFLRDYAPHARTLVAFADDSAGFFWTGELGVALPTDVRWEPVAWVRPLLEALDEHERHAVVLADKTRARIFTVFLGEIEEERTAFAAAETRRKNASGTDHLRSQMHFQRRDEMHVQWHLREVADIVEDMARTRAFDRLILAGPVEATTELARILPRPLAGRVVATLRLPADAPADAVLRETLAAATRAEREAEQRRVADVFERGALGLDATLLALQEGRVRTLLHAAGFESRGGECPRCGALSPDGGGGAPCRYCATQLVPLDDLVGRVVARADAAGAEVDVVHGDAASRLLDAGGIGAILRY